MRRIESLQGPVSGRVTVLPGGCSSSSHSTSMFRLSTAVNREMYGRAGSLTAPGGFRLGPYRQA